MPKTIFELVTSQAIASYWNTLTQDRPPYFGETLFPNDKKLGLDLKWIKGSRGLPVVLKPSAFDVAAVPRARIGFDQLITEMPFFKESTLIDENQRQELNKVLASGNQYIINSIMRHIYDDTTNLIESAAARREHMRMMMLTSGMISIDANGQFYTYDYMMPESHKPTAKKSWSDPAANIVEDIREWQDIILDDTGEKPTRAVVSPKTWQYMLKNDTIKKSVYILTNGGATLSDKDLRNHLSENLGLENVEIYSKRYRDEKGVSHKYMPDDMFTLFPSMPLGKTWFGTTPEESDLMSDATVNVNIVDTGVAVTTSKKTDPVNVDTKVSMITLPSFEMADHVINADVIAG